MEKSIENIEKGLSTVFKEQQDLEGKLNGLIENRQAKEKTLNEGKTFLNQLLDQQFKLKESVKTAKLSSEEIATRANSLDESIKSLSAKIIEYEEKLQTAKKDNIKLLDRFEDESQEICQIFIKAVSEYATDNLTAELESLRLDYCKTNNNINIIRDRKSSDTEDVVLTPDFEVKNQLLEDLKKECAASNSRKERLLGEKEKLKKCLEG